MRHLDGLPLATCDRPDMPRPTMSSDELHEWLRIESLPALDALVGRYITGEEPEIHWEDSYAQMRFDSAEEGLEALREPYFQQFIPVAARPETLLREMRVYSPYSTELTLAWQIVQRLSTPRLQLRIWQDRDVWCAALGDLVPATGRTAPIAICLAALRAKGLEVLLAEATDDAI